MMSRCLFWSWAILLILSCSNTASAGQWGLKVRDASHSSGAEVTGVMPGMPADKGGLKDGDVIMQAEGIAIATAEDFVRVAEAVPTGDPLSILISRQGWEKSVKLYPSKKTKARKWLGMKVKDQLAGQGPGHGARITSVTSGGPADKAGLKAGDVITNAEGRKMHRAKEFVSLVKTLPSGKAMSLIVVRSGGKNDVSLIPGVKPETAHDASLKGTTAPPRGRPDSLKATIAVGDFQVKAANASQFIGDGLREMLITALHNSGYFIVLESIDIQRLGLEQTLSAPLMAKKGSPVSCRKKDAPEIVVYGEVTQFDPLGFSYGQSAIGKVAKALIAFASGEKTAELVTDICVVDVAKGSVLVEQSVPGSARSVQASVYTSIPIGSVSLPVCFNRFRNTPIEKAIRDCLQKAAFFIVNNIPEHYYKHK